MDEQEARQLIYDTYFETIGQSPAHRPAVEDFFKEKIGESLDIPGALEGWPDFLKEALAVDIQREFERRGYFIQNFSSPWLVENAEKTWESLIEHMRVDLVEVT